MVRDIQAKAIVVRLGAWGDMVQITPVLRRLKEDGYSVVVYTNDRARSIILNNPYVDDIMLHDKNIKPEELPELYKKLESQCDRFVNLSGSIEGSLLKIQGTPAFDWPHEKRHEECNVNYIDRTMELAGYPIEGAKTELYFTPLEHSQGRQLRKKHKGKFIILWVLAGSSFHKAYPYAEYVARHVLDNSDSVIYTVGDVVASLLEWKHPRTFNRSDQWSIRKTMLMTKYADLVIGPETGVMNAAGCFDTPKIIFLSHSSEENLTKYWENVHPIHPGLLKCHPCHKLIYTNDQCVVEPGIHAPLCTTRIPWKQVANEIMTIYGQWREKKWGHTLSVTERSTKRTEGCLTA